MGMSRTIHLPLCLYKVIVDIVDTVIVDIVDGPWNVKGPGSRCMLCHGQYLYHVMYSLHQKKPSGKHVSV